MRKAIVLLSIAVILAAMAVTGLSVFFVRSAGKAPKQGPAAAETTPEPEAFAKDFDVYADNVFAGAFATFEEAVDFGKTLENAAVKKRTSPEWLWDNYKPFNVFANGSDAWLEFETFGEAAAHAREQDDAFIYFRKNNSLIWSKQETPPSEYRIEGVPAVLQNPELPRGCEVTSLSMLMAYFNQEVDKMVLAEEVRKDEAPMEWKDGRLYWGDPNKGFVGDMSDSQKNGFGVYHGPIAELLARYFPRRAMDVTGAGFDDIKRFISAEAPVWVITNATYKPLADHDFYTWHTEDGPIKTTYYEHSVVVTGYDERFVYFNDPLSGASFAPAADFAAAWEQMGRQAVTVGK